MKRNKIMLSAILLIAISMVLFSQENNLENQLNKQFESYTNQLPGERVYVHLDKSIYQPGESIWFTAYLLNDFDFRPSIQSDILQVELLDINGQKEQQLSLICKDGIAQGDFQLPHKIAEGKYELKAYTVWQKNDKDPYFFTKEIQVKNLILPRILMAIDFTEEDYISGDKAKAKVFIKDNENKPIIDQGLNWEFLIGDEKVVSSESKTDKNGTVLVEFELPKSTELNDGILTLSLNHNGIRETLSKSIPIRSSRLQFEMYPEGGDLVDGQKTRIAFQALSENNENSPVKGKIVDINGKQIASFESFHKGMGAFDFLPDKDKEYFAQITNPAVIGELFALPKVFKKGYTLNMFSVTKEFITLSVQSSYSEDIAIIVQIRGEIYHSELYNINSGENQIKIKCSDFPMGVAQITLFDSKAIPQAERLVFVNKHKQLNIKMTTDKEKYQPRERVQLTLEVTDQKNSPVSGIFSTAVIDNNLLKMANDRSGKIMAKLLLEPDISGKVYDAAFYFEKSEPSSDQALDYLLMTRGWRRFAWEEVRSKDKHFIAYNSEKATIEGYIFDKKRKQVVKNAKIRIADSDIKVKSDKDGYFKIEGMDIYENIKLKYQDANKVENEYIVSQYNNNLEIDISKEYKFSKTNGQENKPVEPQQLVSSGTSAIKGQIIDAETGEPIPFANVSIEKDGRMVAGSMSDDNGYYVIKPMPTGTFDMRSTFMGYCSHMIQGVQVKSKQILFLDIELDHSEEVIEQIVENDSSATTLVVAGADQSSNAISELFLDKAYYEISKEASLLYGVGARKVKTRIKSGPGIDLDEVVVSAFRKPIIDVDQTITGVWMDTEQIRRMPNRTTEAIASTVGGVFSRDGEIGSVRGARPDQTVIYVDGVRVIGSANVPQAAISEVSVFLGGIPAEFGDTRGGVVSITTKSYLGNFSYVRKEKKEQVIEIPALAVYHKAREFPSMVYDSEEISSDENDFRTTLYWKGDIALDENGTATLEFYNSDAKSTFNITMEGVSGNGLVGRSEKTYVVEK